MIDKVDGNRIGSDINGYLIKALCLVRDEPNKIPRNNKEYTEEMFNSAKKSDLSDPVDCFAMFQYTFGSIFKGVWARNKRGTDYVKECVKNVLIQSNGLRGVELLNENYLDLRIPNNSIIYCDPPYAGTAKYEGDFDHKVFWQWCKDKVSEGHIVYVSEYDAPDDFECIWQKELVSTLPKDTGGKKAVEKLWRF